MNQRIRISLLSAALFFLAGTGLFRPAGTLTAKGLEFRGFSGGMMLHGGYVFSPASEHLHGTAVSAFTRGIGGAIRLHFGDHLRIGSEGYSSTAPVFGNGSYVHSGWGGILADVPLTWKDWTFFAGATVGGGGFKGVYMLEGDASDWEAEKEIIYRKSAFMVVSPFLGAEYRLTQTIRLVVKADCVTGIGRGAEGVPAGPRLYFGVMFYR